MITIVRPIFRKCQPFQLWMMRPQRCKNQNWRIVKERAPNPGTWFSRPWIHGWFWDDFGMILGWFWDDFVMILWWFWDDLWWLCDDFGMICDDFVMIVWWFCDDFGMICDDFVMILGWFVMILWWFCDDFVMILGWFWDDFGMMCDDNKLKQSQKKRRQKSPGLKAFRPKSLARPGGVFLAWFPPCLGSIWGWVKASQQTHHRWKSMGFVIRKCCNMSQILFECGGFLMFLGWTHPHLGMKIVIHTWPLIHFWWSVRNHIRCPSLRS